MIRRCGTKRRIPSPPLSSNRHSPAPTDAVVDGLYAPYRWITSYVAEDKFFCVHEADNEETVRRHAREGGFPCDAVYQVSSVIGPETAKRPAGS